MLFVHRERSPSYRPPFSKFMVRDASLDLFYFARPDAGLRHMAEGRKVAVVDCLKQ